MGDSSPRIAQIPLIGATGIPPPRWSIRGSTRAHVTIQALAPAAFLRSKVSPPSAAPVWRETLPPISVAYSSVLVIQIHRTSLFPGFNRLIAGRTISITDLISLRESSADGVIHLLMTPHGKPVLMLSLEIEALTAAAVINQIAPVATARTGEGSKTTPASETISRIMLRLGVISKMTVKFAQLHPISNAAVTIVGAISSTLEAQFDLDNTCAALMLDVHRVLAFTESAELLPNLTGYADLISQILVCVVRCVRYVHNRRAGGTFDVLETSADSNPRTLQNLQRTLNDLDMRMTQALTVGIAHSASRIEDGIALIQYNQELTKLHPLLMPRVSSANNRPTCFPGTRSSLISQIAAWAALPTDDATSNVFWLFGPAGSGKSTVATTIANTFERLGFLGSFVFFNRDVHERAQPAAMIRTIAYQLATRNSGLQDGILTAIKQVPWIAEMDLGYQFERLILEPALAAPPWDPIVIVIDALDEGGKGPVQEAFLAVLASGLPKLPKHVRVLITSRRDAQIADVLGGTPSVRECDLTQIVSIHEDIRVYIDARLREVQLRHSKLLSSWWPEAHMIGKLVERANGLFIWASVACSYIGQFDPETRLAQIAENVAIRDEAERSLDSLYTTALEVAGDGQSSAFAAAMHDVLSVAITAENPLSEQSIADILGMRLLPVSQLVWALHSVLSVDAEGLIRVVHPSFRDYLTNPDRCPRSSPWYIDGEQGHHLLASRCLDYLSNTLKYNCMNLQTSASFTPPTPGRHPYGAWTPPVYTGSASMEYATRSWIHHTCHVQTLALIAELHKQIYVFYSDHFLHWMEMSQTFDYELDQCIHDSLRFAGTFSETIECHPLLVYETALPFIPKTSTIFRLHARKYPFLPNIFAGALHSWSSCLYTMYRHESNTYSLTLGPSEKIIVSCSDFDVRVWNWQTGVETLPPFESGDEHLMNLRSAVLSTDNTVIYVASMDGVLSSRDAKSGRLRTLAITPSPRPPAHHWNRNHIYSIANCGNGTLIAAGCRDGMILLWNQEESEWLHESLTGHTGPVYCVQSGGTSGNLLLSGSEDTTVRLWEVNSKELLKTYIGHTDAVTAVSFSPDMLEFASGSSDASIRLWNREQGECCVLHGHKEGVLAVSFSPNGHLLASSGRGGEICLWDATERHLVRRYHSRLGGPIHSLLFCDDITLASGAQNGEVRIWDVTEIEAEGGAQWMHDDRVNAIALSRDGTFFASCSSDATIIIWSRETGRPLLPPLRIHESSVNCIAISLDDTKIASGSSDKKIWLSHTSTGEMLDPPFNCEEEVACLAFSPDGTRLVAGLNNNTLVVWDISTRQDILVLSGIPDGRLYSMACAVSPLSERIACFYYHKMNQGFIVWDCATGRIVIHKQFPFILRTDKNPYGLVFIEGPRIWFTKAEEHVVIQYRYFSGGVVEIQAFHIVTGAANPQIAEDARPVLYAQAADIYRSGEIILHLPRDSDHEVARCWDTSGNTIIVGLVSGRVYAVNFPTL
ncbi:hypothetical protein C8R43DRAFT_1190519 [Mycena crocata]|nr:hypothetical protein C8R43DRAFT_1190519 [Mycena crocata]